jgi:hypothetical protein
LKTAIGSLNAARLVVSPRSAPCAWRYWRRHGAGRRGELFRRSRQSRLEFTGVQAGAEFKGTFRKFSAAVDFAPDAPANSHIDVQID